MYTVPFHQTSQNIKPINTRELIHAVIRSNENLCQRVNSETEKNAKTYMKAINSLEANKPQWNGLSRCDGCIRYREGLSYLGFLCILDILESQVGAIYKYFYRFWSLCFDLAVNDNRSDTHCLVKLRVSLHQRQQKVKYAQERTGMFKSSCSSASLRR